MAVSYRESIVHSIALALADITVANGYNSDVVLVGESTLKVPSELGDKFPACFVIDTKESVSMSDVDSVRKLLTVIVVAFVRAGETKLADMREIIADIEKAVCLDPRRGGLALNTMPVSIVTDEGLLENFGEVDFTFTVEYYHRFGNPNAQE